MSTKNEKYKIYYEANKEQIIQKRKEWYELNKEKILARTHAYRAANKEELKAKAVIYNKACNEKKKEANAIGLKAIADKYAPQRTKAMDKVYITRNQIAKDLGVRLSYIDGISRKERYRMPKHKETNGVVYLYDRQEINDWYVFARDILAFHRLGEKIPRKRDLYTFKEGSMGHGLITFMQNNKKLHLRNIEMRRREDNIYGY
jgi:hypothetical protein